LDGEDTPLSNNEDATLDDSGIGNTDGETEDKNWFVSDGGKELLAKLLDADEEVACVQEDEGGTEEKEKGNCEWPNAKGSCFTHAKFSVLPEGLPTDDGTIAVLPQSLLFRQMSTDMSALDARNDTVSLEAICHREHVATPNQQSSLHAQSLPHEPIPTGQHAQTALLAPNLTMQHEQSLPHTQSLPRAPIPTLQHAQHEQSLSHTQSLPHAPIPTLQHAQHEQSLPRAPIPTLQHAQHKQSLPNTQSLPHAPIPTLQHTQHEQSLPHAPIPMLQHAQHEQSLPHAPIPTLQHAQHEQSLSHTQSLPHAQIPTLQHAPSLPYSQPTRRAKGKRTNDIDMWQSTPLYQCIPNASLKKVLADVAYKQFEGSPLGFAWIQPEDRARSCKKPDLYPLVLFVLAGRPR
jgi:hypothetical protein